MRRCACWTEPSPHDRRGEIDAFFARRQRQRSGMWNGRDRIPPDPGWSVVLAGPRVAPIKLLRAHGDAKAPRRRICAHLARQAAPELAGIRLVRSASDLDPRIPAFATAFLSQLWGG